jgi:hypothetical protein
VAAVASTGDRLRAVVLRCASHVSRATNRRIDDFIRLDAQRLMSAAITSLLVAFATPGRQSCRTAISPMPTSRLALLTICPVFCRSHRASPAESADDATRRSAVLTTWSPAMASGPTTAARSAARIGEIHVAVAGMRLTM